MLTAYTVHVALYAALQFRKPRVSAKQPTHSLCNMFCNRTTVTNECVVSRAAAHGDAQDAEQGMLVYKGYVVYFHLA